LPISDDNKNAPMPNDDDGDLGYIQNCIILKFGNNMEITWKKAYSNKVHV